MKTDGKMNMQGVEVVTVEEYKYLVSKATDSTKKEVKKRVQAGWR